MACGMFTSPEFFGVTNIANTMTDVEKLGEKIKTSGYEITCMKVDDKLLKRYLVAHKKVDAAYEKLVASDKWRKDFEVAKINSETPGVIRSKGDRVARVTDGRDQKGRPVYYVAVRNHSFKNRNVEDWTQFIVYLMELGVAKCEADGLDNVCVIFDMRDFSLSCMDYPIVKILYNTLQDHYPEGLGVCLVLNAPIIFTACWAIIRTWLDENTASKIKFVKGNEELSEYVDPGVIPTDM